MNETLTLSDLYAHPCTSTIKKKMLQTLTVQYKRIYEIHFLYNLFFLGQISKKSTHHNVLAKRKRKKGRGEREQYISTLPYSCLQCLHEELALNSQHCCWKYSSVNSNWPLLCQKKVEEVNVSEWYLGQKILFLIVQQITTNKLYCH